MAKGYAFNPVLEVIPILAFGDVPITSGGNDYSDATSEMIEEYVEEE